MRAYPWTNSILGKISKQDWFDKVFLIFQSQKQLLEKGVILYSVTKVNELS